MAPDGATYFPQPLRLRCQPIEDPEANICVGPDHSFIQLATLPPTSTVKAKSTSEEKKPMAGYAQLPTNFLPGHFSYSRAFTTKPIGALAIFKTKIYFVIFPRAVMLFGLLTFESKFARVVVVIFF